MKIFSTITFSWFMILNIYEKHKWRTGKGRDFWFTRMTGRPNFSSFLHQAIKDLTTCKCYTVSDMNHSSHQQVLYDCLWPTVNTDQSATQCSVDNSKHYKLSITKQVPDTMYSIPQISCEKHTIKYKSMYKCPKSWNSYIFLYIFVYDTYWSSSLFIQVLKIFIIKLCF